MGTSFTGASEERQLLSVLDAIVQDSSRSQREISGVTALNLAKVNTVLRRLIEQGLVRLERPKPTRPGRRTEYLITQDGALERSRLALRLIQRTLDDYTEVQQRVRDRLCAHGQASTQRIALLGADDVARTLVSVADTIDNVTIVGVFDDRCCGTQIGHLSVRPLSELPSVELDRLLILPCDQQDAPSEVAQRLSLDRATVEVF